MTKSIKGDDYSMSDSNLILLKNSGKKEHLDVFISYLIHNGGTVNGADWQKYMQDELEKEGLGSDPTSASHKTVMARYFGLAQKIQGPRYKITDLGIAYNNANTRFKKIDILFKALQTVSFGKNNNAVSSNSNIEAPLVFLKLLHDFKETDHRRFGIMLYYLENLKLDYHNAKVRLSSVTNLSSEKATVVNTVGTKYFDPKFTQFFLDLGIIQYGINKYTFILSTYVSNNYSTIIDNFKVISSPLLIPNVNTSSSCVNYQLPTTSSFLNDNLDSTLIDFNHDPNRTQLFKKSTPPTPSVQKTTTLASKKFSSSSSTSTPLTQSQCNALGWSGERYIFTLLNNNNNLLLSELLVSNEFIRKIEWFNYGFTGQNNWEDKSVGKGYDIKVITNKRILALEIKTSYEDVGYYSVSTNELLTMQNEGENYYLLKLNNFKYVTSTQSTKQPSLTTLRNPISQLNNLKLIKDISFYI